MSYLKQFSFITIYVAILLNAPGTFVFADEIQVESVGGGSIGDFVVGPGKVELSLAPGETGQVELKVTNRTGVERDFHFEIEDVTGSDNPDQTIVLLGDNEGPYTLRDYIELPVTKLRLKAGERARIPVTVTIPADAEPGGRYGSVLVNTTSITADTQRNQSRSALVTRVGSLFFVKVEGDIAYEGSLKRFATIPDQPAFASGPITFEILYENSGSVHVNPYGGISITNMSGNEVGFMELEPWYALPKSTRFREVTWERELLFGRYTATLELNRGYNDEIDTATIVFWILPWRVVGGVVVALALLVLVVRFITTRFEFRRRQ